MESARTTDHLHLDTSLSTLFVTTYPPTQMVNGGAAWVDRQILRLFEPNTAGVTTFSATGKEVPLSVQGSRTLQFRTIARILRDQECYQVAKFRQSPGWARQVTEVQDAARTHDQLVTSQLPGLLLAVDAGLQPDLHIAHNVDSVLAKAYNPFWLELMSDSTRLKRIEVDSLRRARSILTISKTDATRLASLGLGAAHLRLETSIRINTPRPRSTELRIGFIGKMSWPPNKDALNVLQNIVVPAVRRILPSRSVSLIVAGTGSDRVSRSPGTVVLGRVNDVADFYRQVDVVVVPRFELATGVSVKLLEAVEFGTPAVASSKLIYDAGLTRGAFSATTPAEMAQIIAAEPWADHDCKETNAN